MRLNKWIAAHSLHSRRKADELIASGRVAVNEVTAILGTTADDDSIVTIDGKRIGTKMNNDVKVVLLLNKPIGYVCSRNGQGAPTVYGLLPLKYHHLDIAGRLDKDSSGLVILTNNGELMQQLTHPSFKKEKVYNTTLDHALSQADQASIESGVKLEDGLSSLKLSLISADKKQWQVTMHEGRNRQIRRTFALLDYDVINLSRLSVSEYTLNGIEEGKYVISK
ncbi:MAG: pseudouridine synthase [bacterium]